MNFCKVTTYIDEYEMIIIVTLTMSKHEFTMMHLMYGDQSRRVLNCNN